MFAGINVRPTQIPLTVLSSLLMSLIAFLQFVNTHRVSHSLTAVVVE